MLNNSKESNYKRPSVLDINNLLCSDQQKSPSLSPSLTSSPASISSYSTTTTTTYSFPKNYEDDYEDDDSHIKAKRRRANVKQLEVLNRVFNRTFFPSTQMRAELGRQLGMSPRTVQIWFQNRRQAMRTRERQRLIKLRNNHETTAK
ncbi:MAG: hypothetical protein EXX96DRAFT_477758 [Benjaminiella poitrasii]|nr:MAG: hypothetical protein EXX96DRAFT_477758 [Benjaminiella poitrasii]